MPLSGVIVRPEVAVGDLSPSSITPSLNYRVPDSGILPDDDTAEFLAVETDLGGTTLTFVNVYIPLRPPTLGTTPLALTLFRRTVETRWCLATLTPTIPLGSPEQEMIGQRPEERPSLLTKISLLDPLTNASPPRKMSPFLAGISSLM